MAFLRAAGSSVPCSSGWQVSHAYTLRAAMSHVRTGDLQRPHVV